jgi:PhnB protein
LVNRGADQVIKFAENAFGAKERFRLPGPKGTIGHAEIEIGDSLIMIADADERNKAMPAMIHLYLEDVDSLYRRALDAGATSIQEPKNQFYGDRNAGVQDAAGNKWYISTHVEDVPPDVMERCVAEAVAQSGSWQVEGGMRTPTSVVGGFPLGDHDPEPMA